MKYLVLLSFAVAFAIVDALPQNSKYTTKYDHVNIEQALTNDKIFGMYFNCLMSQGKCTNEGKELKSTLPDALKTNCSKCTERQRSATDRTLRYVIANRKPEWEQLKRVYDPDNVYVAKYRESAAARGITI